MCPSSGQPRYLKKERLREREPWTLEQRPASLAARENSPELDCLFPRSRNGFIYSGRRECKSLPPVDVVVQTIRACICRIRALPANLYRFDPIFIVAHNFIDFDLDVLLFTPTDFYQDGAEGRWHH
ncbi:hypothetical protein BDK51DRAFT_39649 [Blyttiomyces helicus]|uniref:Tyrosinase copper-binding domain-containing protein n=1 Tax=Blyttiomyces helicus TaxID=388810 RepID=A0A4P9W6V7_9FUNG|nr:hypothetical protein BDK51DRAFT_39649 [Blyttiomyces helicus]|eukprot:RKO85856.1 hypothetical protein BDK51DRAFT_39649 [Blyttiomyces helicus]